VKSSWHFLDTFGFSLWTDVQASLPSKGDAFLMPILESVITDVPHLCLVNRCRRYLRVLFLSDIVDGSGFHILDEAWMGSGALQSVRLESWPNQQRPPSSAWHLWRKYLKISLVWQGCCLRVPLGHWNSFDLKWEWYYCAQSKQLWRLVD